MRAATALFAALRLCRFGLGGLVLNVLPERLGHPVGRLRGTAGATWL